MAGQGGFPRYLFPIWLDFYFGQSCVHIPTELNVYKIAICKFSCSWILEYRHQNVHIFHNHPHNYFNHRCFLPLKQNVSFQQTNIRVILPSVWVNKSKILRTRLEDGDVDLELSSVSTLSSWGGTATSGTGESSISWKEEGLERVIQSTDKRLFVSGTRNFWTERLFLIHASMLDAFSPHAPMKKKKTDLVVVPQLQGIQFFPNKNFNNLNCSQHILSFYVF